MEVAAKGNNIRISPKKARPIASVVRGKNAREAQVILASMPQKAAKIILKVLDSAMANAENNFSLDKSQLTISEIKIDEGPVLKRYRPRAFGRASEIKKRTSHVSVVVSGEVKTKKKATENKSEVEAKITQEDESKKIEIERPQDKINVNANQKGSAPKMFRRKTG
jgi:large subunit ribosomal protein L22